ncbi:MAG: preprotein translocase subunit SecE [Candidatus Staskawiczbacteria bacterium]|nr:preprotein translocase subunit SecE [Candidatus Staskawiczbacteria bacterium]
MITVEKVKSFFKEVYVELRKTNWLSAREVIRFTLLVLTVTIIVSAFLGGLDYVFSTALKSFIVR